MSLSTFSSPAHLFLQNGIGSHAHRIQRNLSVEFLNTRQFGPHSYNEPILGRGCRIAARPNIDMLILSKKPPPICSCWMGGSQLASTAFTLGTVAVLPFYTLMLVAPNAQLTKKAMDSSICFVVLGLVYAYLLYLSWTPDTLRLIFASEYWLPELSGIVKMFSNEMTLASAWIHLLMVDLYTARCIYQDGLKNKVETRHSVSLCLLVCPVGILTHTITKALTRTRVGSRKRSR